MKIKHLIHYAPLAAFLWSCEGDLIDTSLASRKALINASVEHAKTRATDTGWSAGDAIGVYMKKSGVSLSDASVLASNTEYVSPLGTSSFSPGKTEEEIMLPFNGSAVDFIGYSPFKQDIANFIYPVDVTIQDNQSAIDLLYSNNSVSVSSKEPFANMTFVHQLSKVRLNLQAENGIGLTGILVKLTNSPTSASFNLTTGSLSSNYAGVQDILFSVAADGSFAEAILLPTSDFSDKNLVLTFGASVYVHPLSSSSTITSFEKSTQYTYNITLNPGTGVMAVATGNITNWTNGASDNISLSPESDYVDNSKGTKNNPYSVEEAIQNQGRNGVWVKGYIIGYFSGTAKSSFTTSVEETGTISQSNFIISSSADETSIDGITLSVNVPTSTKIKPHINLKDNPQHIKKEILLKGDLGAYFSMPGIKDISSAIIDDTEYSK